MPIELLNIANKCTFAFKLNYFIVYKFFKGIVAPDYIGLKGTVSRDFWLMVFFMNQFPPSIWVYHYGHFEFFRKFAEIFVAQGATGVLLDTGGKLKKSSIRNIILLYINSLKVPSHFIRLGLKCNGWIDLVEYKDCSWQNISEMLPPSFYFNLSSPSGIATCTALHAIRRFRRQYCSRCSNLDNYTLLL